MCEPTDDGPCKFGESLNVDRSGMNLSLGQTIHKVAGSPDFEFACGPLASEDDDEVTESKIRAFLDEKVKFC